MIRRIKKVIYISGPYRSATEYGVHRNIQEAELYAALFWEAGYTALCPHKNTAYFSGLVPDENFLEGALELMRRSDALFLPPTWRASEGTVLEREEAERILLPIIFSVEEADNVFKGL